MPNDVNAALSPVVETASGRLRGPAPQLPGRPGRPPELQAILGPADTTPESEDCLTLNVWRPGLGEGAKRPGDGLAAWRCLRLRLGQPTGDRDAGAFASGQWQRAFHRAVSAHSGR